MQHAEQQRLSQTITPCDGSVLLDTEMKLKCLIDFSVMKMWTVHAAALGPLASLIGIVPCCIPDMF